MRTGAFLVLTTVLGLLGACSGGGAKQIPIGAPPARQTTAVLVGALCTNGKCTCRNPNAPGDAGVGFPTDASRKRYEIRIGPSPQELWVSEGATVFYKSAERAEECFYVDLAPGDHPFELRASNAEGVSAAFAIHELGTQTKSWYDTFRFTCGSPGVCSFEEMDMQKAEHQTIKRNLRDPCGSTKVKSVSWDHGKAPDGEHPSELLVRLTLNIYKLVPTRPTGDPSCGTGGGHEQAEDVTGAPAVPAPESPAP